ncbi:MAG: nucleic acid-binding protein [Myxococcota bacterium]
MHAIRKARRPRLFESARRIVDDAEREFVCSVFLRLELLPKPLFNGHHAEATFYREFFGSCADETPGSERLLQDALDEAIAHGMGAVDAMHVVAAETLGVDEFVTAERPEKSIHRTSRIRVVSLEGRG